MTQHTETYPRIEDLIPHRGGMLLIDDILELTTETAVSRTRVKDTWPVSAEGAASPLILIELVAQTSGLCNGLGRIHIEGEDSENMGFLVGVKQAMFHVDTLSVGDVVVTEVRNCFKFESFREIEGVARVGGKIAAEVTLQVMRVEE